MNEPAKELEAFSFVKRAKSFTHAYRGLQVFFKTQHNAWIQITLAGVAVILGFFFSLPAIEWTMLILAMGLVFVAEAVNTAIEFDIDLTSPEFHPFARDTKDVAAAAVLIASFIAFIIGGILFVPKIIALF